MRHLYGCGLRGHKPIQSKIKLSVLGCNMLTTCLLRVIAHLVPCSFLGTDRCSPFPGLQLFFLWSYWSSCDQWHSLKLGFSIFLPLMATVTMCAAAALSQSPHLSGSCAWLPASRACHWHVAGRVPVMWSFGQAVSLFSEASSETSQNLSWHVFKPWVS